MKLAALAFAAALAPAVALAQAAAAPAYAVTARIAGPDGGWDYASFDPGMRRLYVARRDGVMAVDVDSGKVTRHLADAQVAHEVLPVKNGAELLETDGTTNTARFLDAQTGAVLATVPVGQKPDAAILDTATGLAVVMNGKSGDLTLIDPKTRAVVGSVMIGGALEFGAGDGSGRVFVNVEDKGEMAVVDLRARAVVGRIALTGCDEPSGLAYAASARMMIAACANKVAAVVDPSTMKLVKTLTIGARPDAAFYDARRKLVFIPAGGDGVLEVIGVADPRRIEVVAHVPTQKGARTGAVDERTGRIYLPAAQYGPPATPGGRPSAVPGSFVVLVVAPQGAAAG